MDKIIKIKSKIKNTDQKKRHQEILSAILTNRGITTKISQKEFLDPIDPYKIQPKDVGINQKNLKKAVARIKKAIKNKELIYIYGDYDTDGITSTAVLWETLHHLKAKVMPYIPSRGDNIRGLSPAGVDQILTDKDGPCQLIITVDNGISTFKGTDYANKKNIDVIITDHHQPKTKNNKPIYPKAFSIIHTTKLAGVGVAWFLARELGNLETSLELVAIGTIADMVPLTNANRSLVKFGLKSLKKSKRIGLNALANISKLDLPNILTYQISFVLAPRLNAMARLKHALDSLRLLCTTNQEKANQLAKDLNQTNLERQDKTFKMYFHAKEQWLSYNQPKKKLIFVSHQSYHQGVVGLVASRLVEKFYKPAFVVSVGETFSKASARSIKGFNVLKAIRSIEDLILEHGGHKMAAGFTAKNVNLPKIQKRLENLAKDQLTKKQLTPIINIDCELKTSDINWDLFNNLQKIKPTGFGNKPPLFISKQIKLLDFRTVGQNQKHLKLTLQGPSLQLNAIAFNLGHLAKDLAPNQSLDLIYTLDKNEWNNQKTLQLKVKQILL
ncbi:MAG: single-stranded-DNA-specific exonuclease RecJ [Patescibacteria group bacterium]|nr:single-stranded-DNA-specific exonuclease RecJ [Patescibacteria group bacterium]